MDARGEQEGAARWLSAAVAVFGQAGAAVNVIVPAGCNIGDPWDGVLPIAFALAALFAFAGWARDRRARGLRAVAAEREAERTKQELEAKESELEELRTEAKERGERLGELEETRAERER